MLSWKENTSFFWGGIISIKFKTEHILKGTLTFKHKIHLEITHFSNDYADLLFCDLIYLSTSHENYKFISIKFKQN